MSAPHGREGVAGGQTASIHAGSSGGPAQPTRLSPTITPALLTDEQSADFLGVSQRKFHELRAEPWWTVKPVVLGPRLLRWPAAELVEAIAAMPRQETKGSEPAALARAKINRMKAGGIAV